MNAQITNGKISYGRTIKTGDFEDKRGDVELSFNVAEGSDPETAITYIEQMAAKHLTSLLSLKESAEKVAPAAAVDGPKPPAKPKTAPKLPKAAPPVDASMVDETDFSERPPLPPAAKPAEAKDDLESWETEETESVKEITDKELNDAAQRCQSANKNGLAIRKLITETLASVGVKSPPGRLIDIPQNKRQEFLEGLDKVKPLA